MMPRFRGQGAKQAFSQVTVRRSLVSWVQADLGAPHDRVDPISCSNFKLLLSRTTAELLLSCATVRRLAAHTPHAWLVPAPGRVHNDSIGWTGRSAAGPQTDTVTVTYGRSARAPWNQIRAAVSAQGGSAAQGIGGTNSEKKSDPRRPRGVADTAEAGPRVPTRSGTRDGLVGVRGSRPLSGRPNAVVRARLAPGTSHHARASQAASPAKTLTVGCEPVRPPTTDRAWCLAGAPARETGVVASAPPGAPLQVYARAQPPPICPVKRPAQAVVEVVDTEAAVAALPVRLPQPPNPVPNGCDGRAAPTADAAPPPDSHPDVAITPLSLVERRARNPSCRRDYCKPPPTARGRRAGRDRARLAGWSGVARWPRESERRATRWAIWRPAPCEMRTWWRRAGGAPRGCSSDPIRRAHAVARRGAAQPIRVSSAPAALRARAHAESRGAPARVQPRGGFSRAFRTTNRCQAGALHARPSSGSDPHPAHARACAGVAWPPASDEVGCGDLIGWSRSTITLLDTAFFLGTPLDGIVRDVFDIDSCARISFGG